MSTESGSLRLDGASRRRRHCRARRPPVLAGCLAQALALAPGFTAPALAEGMFLPVAGDRFQYALSSGERVTLEVVRVRPRADQLLATVTETTTTPDGERRVASFDIIRTQNALAIDMPSGGDNARLSPLVYFFAPAARNDSWLAQQGVLVEPGGAAVPYRLLARVDAIETVSGPAGVFPGCRRVSYSSSLDRALPAHQVVQLTLWLHPEIGIVRSYSRTGTRFRLTELVQYRKLLEPAAEPPVR